MNKFKILATLLMTLAIASCGGSSGGTITGNGGTGGGAGAGGGGGAETEQGTVSMGAGDTSAFFPGVIDLGGVTALSAGGSVSMSVVFVIDDGSGTLTAYTEPVDVTFSSPCIPTLASVNPAATVTSVAGLATATYVAQGCDTGAGGEVITARANVNGTELTAQVNLVVAGADVGSIQFVSATPDFIGLKGSGGQGIAEQSTVIFRVVDASTGPVAGKQVDFTLNTEVGGITLTPLTATSDSSGFVQTVVQSGTVATSLRVTATEFDTGISTQSDRLTISTGIPHQDAFSLSLGTCNTNTFSFDGFAVPVNVFLSDRFQNPVPDGTAIAFTAEGGQIQNSCVTDGGSCTVNWTSTNPRPAALPGDVAGQTGGRVTIVATAIGEESFLDEDGDFVYDSGEAFGDLQERFRDDNENGAYDIGVDGFFLDFNNSGTHDASDGTFNGLLCSSGCSASETLGISGSAILVMGTSGVDIVPDADPVVVPLQGFGTANLTVAVTDLNGNYPAAGTTVTLSDITNGSVVGPDSYIVPDACGASPGPYLATFAIEGDDTPSSGTVFIEVTTPAPNSVITIGAFGVDDI